ncbi:hypothetical protein [Limnospira platensis]|uniref:hypothetical protein n=1 Tax=Limnospira platensis TaxID=118562 RepID=UPI0024CA28FE|nr:hypothetical protein AP9108_35490 [Arthrospira sp. PCC 9108]
MAVVSILVLGYTSEPSVPRFNPRIVNPETGGGYRRYSQLSAILGGSQLHRSSFLS